MADKYTQKDRDAMAKKGHAMPDGSYPIADAEDLDNAIHAVGRGSGDHDAIRKHIIARAKALGLSSKIPDNWNADGSMKAAMDDAEIESRKAKALLLEPLTREVRQLPTSTMECRTVGDTITFRGLASSVESPYEMGFYTETIKRGAFDKTLAKRPDVMLLANHEGLPIARTTNGSLTLSDMGNGLEFHATAAADDPDAARVAAKVSAGLMDQCSFAFRVVQQDWNEDYSKRDISEVSLDRGDVSIVNYGANPNTSVSLRSILSAWDELTPADIAELRVKLGLPPEDEPAPMPNLSLFQARADALRLRQPSNSASR